MLTIERLHSVLYYDQELGMFFWLTEPSWKRFLKRAGSTNSCGYVVIRIGKTDYYAHRLAWFWMTGEWPKNQIDHVNGDPSDNRWANLREATQSQNNANQRRNCKNSTGFKGVYFHKLAGKFLASIKVKRKDHYLGLFDTAEEAHAAYTKAANEHFGEFARAA